MQAIQLCSTKRTARLRALTTQLTDRLRGVTGVLPLSEAAVRLAQVAERVERERDRVLLTRDGCPSCVLISADELESLEESLDIACDADLMASIRISRAQAAEGLLLDLRDEF